MTTPRTLATPEPVASLSEAHSARSGDPTSPRLVTASYRTYRPEMGVPIRTTVGTARWFPHPVFHARACTPYGVFGKYHDEAEYREAYIARLNRYGAGVVAELASLVGDGVGVLLCFCDLSKSFCHRRILAEWLEAKFRLTVPEVGDPPTLTLSG